MNPIRLLAVVRKELMQLRRDRLTFAMIVGIPTLQLLLFGFAINLDVRHLPAAVLDQANTAHSRELVAELASSQVLDFRHKVVVSASVPAAWGFRLGARCHHSRLTWPPNTAVSQLWTMESWVVTPPEPARRSSAP